MKPRPSSQTLHGLFEEAVKQQTSNTALVADNGKQRDAVVINYGTLASLSTKLAEEIKKRVKKENQVIAVIGEEFHNVLIAVLGILQVPAAFTFVPRKSPEKRTLGVLSRIEASLIVTCEEISEAEEILAFSSLQAHKAETWISTQSSVCKQRLGEIKFLQTTFKMSTERVIVEDKTTTVRFCFIHLAPFSSPLNCQEQCPVPLPLAYVVFTSGTTGDPKMVKVPHQCIVPNILHLRDLFGVCSSDVIFNAAPLTFDPSIVEIFLALSSGAKLVAVSDQTKVSPDQLVSALEKHRVTILQTTPSLLFRVNQKSLSSTILSNNTFLRILAFGGEPCPSMSKLSECCHESNKTEIYNLYGITEVSSWASCYHLKRNSTELDKMDSVPLGDPLLDTLLEVRDEDGVALTEGEGQLFIGSSTRVCFIDDEKHSDVGPVFRATGDFVKITPRSGLLFLGRRDDQVKRFGKRFSLGEVTKIIEGFPEVVNCRAVLDDSCKPSRLYAFYVPTWPSDESKSFQETEEGQRLKVRLKDHILEEALPDYVFTVDTFPVTHHGKLNTENLKKQAREYLADLCSRFRNLTAEQMVEGYLKETLSISGAIDMSKSFVDLGGSSFQAVNFVEKLERNLKKTDHMLLDCILHKSIGEVISQIKETAGCSRLPNRNDKSEISAAALIDSERDVDKQSNLQVMDEYTMHTKPIVITYSRKQINTEELKEAKNSEEKSDFKRRKHGHGGDLTKGSTVIKRGRAVAMDTNATTATQSMADSCAMFSMKEKWNFDLEKCIDASPLVVKRERAPCTVAFIGSHSGLFVSLDVDTGRRLWQVRLPDRIESSACLSSCETFVVVGCYDDNVYFLDQSSGSIHWIFKTLGPVKSSPTSDPSTGLVYIGSHDGNIYALGPEIKRCLWSVSDGGAGSIFSSPCVDPHNNCLFAASLSGKLLCLSKESGEVKWYYQCPKPVFSSPAVTAGGGVVLGCVDGCIYHLNRSGKLVHCISTEAPVFSSPCVVTDSDKEIVVIGSHDGCVYSIDLSSGKILWKTKIGKHVYSTPSCIFNNIDSGILRASKLGSNSQAICQAGTTRAACTTFDGLVCCSSTDGTLVVLDLTTGNKLTSHLLPGEIFSSPLFYSEDRSIIVGCRNNRIYSVSLDSG